MPPDERIEIPEGGSVLMPESGIVATRASDLEEPSTTLDTGADKDTQIRRLALLKAVLSNHKVDACDTNSIKKLARDYEKYVLEGK